jgi:hypothetical protein
MVGLLWVTDSRGRGLLLNTFQLAAGALAIALPIGGFLGLTLARSDVVGRRIAAALLGGLLLVPLCGSLAAGLPSPVGRRQRLAPLNRGSTAGGALSGYTGAPPFPGWRCSWALVPGRSHANGKSWHCSIYLRRRFSRASRCGWRFRRSRWVVCGWRL